MHREGNLFGRIIDFSNLHRGFRGAAHGKRDRPEVREFEYDLEPCLWQIRRDLEAGTHRWGAYRIFWITDPKRREIRAAPFRDRVVHHAVCNVIEPVLQRGFIRDTYACLPGRGTHHAINRFRDFAESRAWQGYRLQGDIKSYFASVDHAVLMDLLGRRIGCARTLALLASLLAHGGNEPGRGMPIGNLTSQLFANLYLDPLDHFVKERLQVRHYLRYMDDFVLLCSDRTQARRWLAAITAFLAERCKLRLNPRRIVLAPLALPCDILGYVHFADGRRRVRRRSVRRLWRRLPVLHRRLAAGEIGRDAARASVASWFGLSTHADAFRLSRCIFLQRDVENLGKRLLLKQLRRRQPTGNRRRPIASTDGLCRDPKPAGVVAEGGARGCTPGS